VTPSNSKIYDATYDCDAGVFWAYEESKVPRGKDRYDIRIDLSYENWGIVEFNYFVTNTGFWNTLFPKEVEFIVKYENNIVIKTNEVKGNSNSDDGLYFEKTGTTSYADLTILIPSGEPTDWGFTVSCPLRRTMCSMSSDIASTIERRSRTNNFTNYSYAGWVDIGSDVGDVVFQIEVGGSNSEQTEMVVLAEDNETEIIVFNSHSWVSVGGDYQYERVFYIPKITDLSTRYYIYVNVSNRDVYFKQTVWCPHMYFCPVITMNVDAHGESLDPNLTVPGYIEYYSVETSLDNNMVTRTLTKNYLRIDESFVNNPALLVLGCPEYGKGYRIND
jgi:hypothetical protein